MEEREFYTIGEASVVTGMSTNTLRYYDSLGLVVPEGRNPQNNYRYYSKNQVASLLAIQRLRKMGCGLKSLRIVAGKMDLLSLYEQIRARIEELNQEIQERQTLIDENTDFLNRLGEAIKLKSSQTELDDYLLNNMRIEEIPVSYLFCQERIMPHYNVTDTSVSFRSELYTRCARKGLKVVGPEVTTYYTHLLGQFVMHDCKIRIGITVENDPGCPNIQEFGGFLAATALHIGTYETMVNTHMSLLRWINRNGYEVNGEVSESFLVSPIDIMRPEDQIIKVIMPIRKIS